MSYLHHGVFFYELIIAGCERQVPVYAQRANKRNNSEHVHVLHDGTLWKTNKNKQLLLLIRICIIMRCKRTTIV